MALRSSEVAWRVLLMVLWLALAGPGRAQPVAILTEVDGSVRVVAHGRTVQPEVAAPIDRGAIVLLERDARVVLAYPGAGSIYELRGPGSFEVRQDAVEARSSSGVLARRDLASTLRALRIRPEGTTLQGSAAMRGTGALQLQAEGPTGSQFTRDALRFCWRPLGGHWSYRVRLIDDDGLVVFEASTPDSRFELPAEIVLQPDAPYLWRVLATGPNGQSAEEAGQFRRLDAASEQALLQAESALAGMDATERTLVRIARQQRGVGSGAESNCPRAGTERATMNRAGVE
jgi:hypothetical protein